MESMHRFNQWEQLHPIRLELGRVLGGVLEGVQGGVLGGVQGGVLEGVLLSWESIGMPGYRL